MSLMIKIPAIIPLNIVIYKSEVDFSESTDEDPYSSGCCTLL